ncbi:MULTISPECIES: peptidase inhibitor family I36 protein [unclassified Streptomyces]|uniref:peptidase inhibitor family I36 protein n=1 Tax=unclassified Streptomyces TaxID=2593676 RepID=UPI002E37AA8C|nr:peptidase inhibitor family I36 protein [Streptomyces sp. NBC_01268]
MTLTRTHIRRGSLVTAVLALLSAAFLVLPASAEPAPFDDCPADTLCLYGGTDGTGERRDFTATQSLESYDATWDGRTLSAKNNTKLWSCVYVDAHYGGRLQTIKPGNSDEYTTDPNFNGTISSHKLVPSRAHCFTGYERCPDNRVCTFTEERGRGAMTVHLPATDPATKNYGDSYGPETAPKSVFNRTRKHACFYPEPTYSGTWTDPADQKKYGAYVVLRGDSTTVPAPYTGTFRSHELVNGTSECQ